MSEKSQILFMQTRLIRLASEKLWWNGPSYIVDMYLKEKNAG